MSASSRRRRSARVARSAPQPGSRTARGRERCEQRADLGARVGLVQRRVAGIALARAGEEHHDRLDPVRHPDRHAIAAPRAPWRAGQPPRRRPSAAARSRSTAPAVPQRDGRWPRSAACRAQQAHRTYRPATRPARSSARALRGIDAGSGTDAPSNLSEPYLPNFDVSGLRLLAERLGQLLALVGLEIRAQQQVVRHARQARDAAVARVERGLDRRQRERRRARRSPARTCASPPSARRRARPC